MADFKRLPWRREVNLLHILVQKGTRKRYKRNICLQISLGCLVKGRSLGSGQREAARPLSRKLLRRLC